MSVPSKPLRLLKVAIRTEQDVVVARQKVRQLAGALGFTPQLQTRIATALSEIARNAIEYGGGGWVDFSVLTERAAGAAAGSRQTLALCVSDNGPGIANLDEILAGRYRSGSGLGLGIMGARKLMDQVEIQTSSAGVNVTMTKVLPPSAAPRNAVQLQAIADDLAQRPGANPIDEIYVQNQELVRAIDESQAREDELNRMNQELAETNTGVLALYDELDTLHQIGTMLASKIELKPLIQAIIDVTTSLTEADIGVFFYREENTGRWQTFASAGPKAAALENFPASFDEGLFGLELLESGLVRIADIRADLEANICRRFVCELGERVHVHSCLAVPVVEANQTLLGALTFVSERPNAFSERSERILTSVATQVVVGIEKARLFQSVTAASDAKDQFLAMISHELRTPLNPAMAIISSLQRDPRVPQEVREDIEIVWRNIRLEARLIDDLLDFNRLIKGKMPLISDVLDMHGLVESVVAICGEDLQAKQHRLRIDLGAQRTTVSGDSARLQQVLWNVLKNAIKFTPADGEIHIRTSDVAGALRIEVVDNGRGIEAGAIERIFRAFDQGQPHLAAHYGGLGLGLSIARMFIDLHRGKIFAASAGLGHGATITIELPVIDPPAPSAAALAQPRPSAPAGGSNTGRILLVDDHVDTLQTMAKLLRRRGYEVVTAGSGAEAMTAAHGAAFDLLISDLGLPDCSGLQLVQRVRSVQPLPAIALSGYGMEQDVAESKQAGFQRHLTKPVDFEELARAIQGLLGQAAS